MELFANDVEVAPERTQEYWDVSADLITLVSDVEAFEAEYPDADNDDFDLLHLRRRLRLIGARLTTLSLE